MAVSQGEITSDHVLKFWSKVEFNPDGCWIWTRYKYDGYGRLSINRKVLQAHTVSYTLVYGNIPEGLQIDHLCRNRACVAPDHLEAVTQQENMRRGNSGKHLSIRTRCNHGHEFDQVREGTHGRRCSTCAKAASRRHYERSKLNG